MSSGKTNAREVRSFAASQPFSVRTLADGTKEITGYAIVFNSRSQDLGGFVEECDPGMLARTLRENPDVLMLRDHKQELLLARTKANTLQLRVDNVGLAFTATMPPTEAGNDAYQNAKLGNLQGCSFGFNTVADDWRVLPDGTVLRVLLDIDLAELSLCSFPAYTATTVSARSRQRAAEMRSQVSQRDDDDDEDDEEYRPECDPDHPDFDPDAVCDDDEDEDEEDRKRADNLRIRTMFHHKILNNTASQ